jgi:uncharacterized membrane protein
MDTKRFSFADAVALGSLALAAGLSGVVFERLPSRVATHFDLHGNADGFMPREAAAFFLPAFAFVLWALLRLAPRILPASERRRLGERTMPFIAAVKAVFLSVLHLAVLAFALVPGFSLMTTIWLGVGAAYAALGLVLPRVRRNGLVGIRTPWTLASDENWARTHRVAGYAMIAAGLLAAIAGTLGGATGAALAIGALIAGAVVPSVYSLVLARRMDA